MSAGFFLGTLGELKRFLRREHSLAEVRGASGEEGGWKYVEGAEMNEKGYFKIHHRQRFHLQVKMHVCRRGLRPDPLREPKRSQY